MAGLFGLFGGKTKYVGEPDQETKENNGDSKKGSYFLEPDDAKTLGDIEFMRKPNTIRRSFPKTLKGGGGEFIQQVSSMDKAKMNGNGQVAAVSSQTEEKTVQPAPEANTRRSSDDNLDMFRRMAKDMKK
ncbi:MAG: hypothetical protein AB4041_21405 [Microcystaceae cyanobacterium]